MSNLKLLYVVHSLNPGGAERLAVQMSQAFAGEFEVSLVCLDEPGLWAGGLRRRGIPVHCLNRQSGLDISTTLKLAQYCRRRQVDIIHAHQRTPWFYAGLSRLVYSAPRLLFEEHGRVFPEVMNRKRMLLNRIAITHLTHRFVAVSEDVRDRLVKYEGLDRNRIDVVYNGVAPDQKLDSDQRNQLRRSFGAGPEDFLVGTAVRFDPVKNLPMFLKSIAAAREKIASIRGLLVGNGPAFEQVRGLRDDLRLSDAVMMTGHRDDARELIQCMDLFVLSSFSEGISMALLEAIAAGVPVAVTDVGGNPEVVVSGMTGWVVASDSVRDLKNAILEAVFHPQKAKYFADSGRLRFDERFTLEKMLGGYRRVYSEMMK